MSKNTKLKITFKKHPKEKGLAAVGYPYQNVDIKVDGKVVGTIYAPSWRTKGHIWQIKLQVIRQPTKDWPADFATFSVLKDFASEQDARDWARKNLDRINAKRPLYKDPD